MDIPAGGVDEAAGLIGHGRVSGVKYWISAPFIASRSLIMEQKQKIFAAINAAQPEVQPRRGKTGNGDQSTWGGITRLSGAGAGWHRVKRHYGKRCTDSTQHVQSHARVTPGQKRIFPARSSRAALTHVATHNGVSAVECAEQSFGWRTSLNLVSGGAELSKLRKTGTWTTRLFRVTPPRSF